MKNSQTFSTRRIKLTFVILIVLIVLTATASIGLGAVRISAVDIYRALFGDLKGSTQANIILLTRLPRTIGCLLAGMALAVAGAVIQKVLSNPLAAPNVIGVNSGAGLMAALFSAIFPTKLGYMPIAAFFGALIAVMLVLLISEKTGASKTTLVLAGVATSSVFSAIIDAIVTFFPDALNGYSDFRIGGFANVTMSRIMPAVWVCLIAIIGLLLLTNELDVLSLGVETAQSLGLKVKPLRVAMLIFASALAGAAVSFAGLIGFVGLIVPHIMRRIVGEGSKELIVSCALGGAVFVTACDVISRVIFAPYELSVGIMLSCIGGPFFIWLITKQRKGRKYD